MSIFLSIKRLFKQSAIYGVGHILSRAMNFLLLPLHSNLFHLDLMGVAGIIYAYIGSFKILYTFGIDAAFFRYYMGEKDRSERKRVFTTAFLTVFLVASVLTILIFTSANWIAQLLFKADTQQLAVNLPILVRIASLILFFDTLAFMQLLILRAEEKPLVYSIFTFANVIITITANIVFILVLKLGVEAIFYANLLASGLTFLIVLPLGLKHLDFSFSLPLLKKLFIFGIPYLPSTLAIWAMDSIDRLFLERMINIDAVGLYSQGAKLGMFMALFVSAFRFAWIPYATSTAKQENAKEVFAKILTYVVLACSGVFLFFSFFINDIVKIGIGNYTLLGKDYWEATIIVPLFFLAYIFYAAYLNLLIGVYLEKKTKYIAIITIIAMAGNVLANYLLIPHLGIMGAAWARLISYVMMAFGMYIVAAKIYPIKYEWKRLFLLAFVILSIYFIGDIYFPSVFLVKALLFVISPVILYLFGFFEKGELAKLKSIVASKHI
jgi:O-antigen/teichoic acid export membrane protein